MNDPPPAATPTNPSASVARALRLPRLSGKASAAWLVVCFALTGLLIPLVLGLPQWIEFEIVLAIWWVVWLVLLTHVLYSGRRVTDDHRMGEPRNWFASMSPNRGVGRAVTSTARGSRGSWWDGFFWGSMIADGEGVAIGCAIVIALIVLVGAIWYLIEIAIPVVAFLAYLLTRGMLAHVVNDRHNCHGRLGRSLSWAFVWATLYTAPLAGVVWFVHFALSRQQGA